MIKKKNTTLLFNFFSFFTSWKLLVMTEAKSVLVEEIKGLFGRSLVQCDGQVCYALNTPWGGVGWVGEGRRPYRGRGGDEGGGGGWIR